MPTIDALVVYNHYRRSSQEVVAGLILDPLGDEWFVNCTGGNR